jgi:eukaryotic-like serine/threonine-protein kinase
MTEQTIFLAALDMVDPAERAAYMDGACAGDETLRRQVEALFAAHERSGEFLDVPAIIQVAPAHAQSDDGTVALEANAEGAHIVAVHKNRDNMSETEAEQRGEEEGNALTFLQPSTKPGSLGRLGHYEVLEVLGRGGFGIVVKAFDEMLHRVVAIKVMSVQLAATSPARKRFLREARASAAVRHEHVVAIHAVEEQPIPYLVMEYIAGETLQQKLDRVGPLDVPDVVRLGRQIAAGLAAAHAEGLIHRDVKPGNILLETGVEPRVKITDFGLARAADDASLTQSGVIAGTPMYMAPEQAAGEHIDQRADLFSLGSVLYVMCSGRPPFRASTTLAVLKRVAEDTPRPIREIIPEVPEWLCAIIAKLHEKAPADRVQSAKKVAEVLGEHLGELQFGAPGRAVSESDRSKSDAPAAIAPFAEAPGLPRRRFGMKRTAVLAAAACALAAMVIAAGVYYWPPGLFKGMPVTSPVIHPDTPPLAVAPFDAAQAKAHQEAWAKHLGVDVEITNSIGMKLRLIPPGQFLMGSPDDEPGREAQEGPQHQVVITRPFYMGVHDVTVGQFKAFVKAKGYLTEAEKGQGAWQPSPDGFWKQDPQVNWQNPRFEQGDDHPIVCVSWNDAKAYCDWLSEREGKKYTLPTEAEWEYACRAGSNTRFSFGDDDQELGEYAWSNANSKGKTHPVGQKRPNAWDLYDMEGNVSRWTADWHTGDYYQKSPQQDPPGPRAGTIGTRVLRGGNWWWGANESRAAHRNGDFWHPWQSATNIGFRVVQVGDLKSSPVEVVPFVVLAGKGQPERSFATLKDAVDKAQAGDTIEIRGNGPFRTAPIFLDKALNLRAGAGYRPVLVHTTDGSLLYTTAPLVLEGLEFHSFGHKHKGNASHWALLHANGTSLRIAHCRILVKGDLSAIQTFVSPLVEVRNSEVFNSSNVAVDCGLMDRARFVIQNCCMGRATALAFYELGKPARDVEVELTDNTFVTDPHLWSHRFSQHPVDAGKADFRSVRFNAIGNVFQSRQRFGDVESGDTDKPNRSDALADWYRDHITWDTRANLFAITGDSLAFHQSGHPPAQTWKTYKDWQAFWKVEKAPGIEGSPRFAGGDLLDRLDKDPLSVTVADFRLEKGSPGQGACPGGKDLGADVDHVGPGEPYERWKTTPEYQQWLKDTARELGTN